MDHLPAHYPDSDERYLSYRAAQRKWERKLAVRVTVLYIILFIWFVLSGGF